MCPWPEVLCFVSKATSAPPPPPLLWCYPQRKEKREGPAPTSWCPALLMGIGVGARALLIYPARVAEGPWLSLEIQLALGWGIGAGCNRAPHSC